MIDSARSPTTPIAPITIPSRRPTAQETPRPNRTTATAPVSAAETRPPISPATVFFGLTTGINGRRPYDRPTKYAPESESQVIGITTRSQARPRGAAAQPSDAQPARSASQPASIDPSIFRIATAAKRGT